MATDDNNTSVSDAYEIVRASDTTPKTLEVDGKNYKFRGNNMMRVKDRGLAFSIRDKYGKGKNPDIIVNRVNYPDHRDRGHRFFFGQMPEMPWKRNKDAASNQMGQGSL